jgi:hypothetical protein
MEIAIPGIALGIMYILSNKEKPPETYGEEQNYGVVENYENLNRDGLLVKSEERNYPEDNTEVNLRENTMRYASETSATDEFFKSETHKNRGKDKLRQENNVGFTSLTGDAITRTEMHHNNMVPFFGSKVTQRVSGHNESLLDSYSGSGSQHIKKEERGPLFKPESDMNWQNGMPNANDFIQERMRSNITGKQNNSKPFESIQVGPGLNQGYGSEGTGGYNSALMQRDTYKPKSVDELRTENNPKQSYKGVVLGAKAAISNMGIHGKIEKNRPDTFFINDSSRWFTTTGVEKAQTGRPEYIIPEENRETTTREHYGLTNNTKQGIYQQQNYEGSFKSETKHKMMGAPNIKNKWNGAGDDYGKKGFSIVNNNRTDGKQADLFGPVGRGAMAVVAPILDMLRPSRKENMIGNINPVGYVRGRGETFVKNMRDKPKTTIKEQTEDTKHMLMGGLTATDGYTVNMHQPISNQRDTTNKGYVPNASASISNARIYTAEYNANLNDIKEINANFNRPNVGSMQLFNGDINVQNVKNEGVNPGYMSVNMPNNAPSKSTYGSVTYKNGREVDINMQRNQGDILDAFKNNPYTKSLSSVA